MAQVILETGNTSWTAQRTGPHIVECWGGGGGGGSYGRTSSPHGASGAGGGAYARSIVECVTGTAYTISVGQGGAAGANNANGTIGNNTHFNNNEVKASAGQRGNNTTGTAAGGTVANCVYNDVAYAGGAGAANSTGNVGGGAGSGGWNTETGKAASTTTGGAGGNNGGNGGNGGANNGAGVSGTIPGGGGGGAGANMGTTFKAPGTGANGRMIITWPDILAQQTHFKYALA